EGLRWTRAVGIIPATPYEVMVRCGLACGKARLGAPGWAGEKSGLFEHPTAITDPLPSTQALISDRNGFHYTFVQALSRIYKLRSFNHILGRVGRNPLFSSAALLLYSYARNDRCGILVASCAETSRIYHQAASAALPLGAHV
ncbi:MAG: hypothetical protein ND866_28990, partial [Pyrinomonadaceae bacterium]|nr:hypothetical protein [Pyrinomonadaceae bacterium]